MTTTQSSTVTTTQIRHEGSTALSTSFDCTSTDPSTRTYLPKLQLLIGQAIDQWWNTLSRSQRSVLVGRKLSLKTSASCRSQTPSPEAVLGQPEFFPLLNPEDC